MKPEARKVLITGATGFVGSWLTKKLLDLGHDVHILSRQQHPRFEFDSSRVHVSAGDVNDPASLLSAFRDMHSIFHLAGVVGYSRAMRQEMLKTNVEGTKNVIDAVEKSGCEKLVHMSSVVAIGASFDGKTPLNENSKYNIRHLDLGYYETKRMAEEKVTRATKAGRIQSVILNPATIYGPGDAKKGSRKTQVKVAAGKFPFYTGGGVNVIHIADAIDAICRAWEVGRSGERYILAGENITIKQLFEIIAEEGGVKPPKLFLPNPVLLGLGKVGAFLEKLGAKGPISLENAWAAILFNWFDNSKAKKELGLNPRPAREAIRESVAWMKKNGMVP